MSVPGPASAIFRCRVWTGWRAFLRTLEGAPSGPRSRLGRWVVLPLALLLAITALEWLTDFDLGAQRAIYRAGDGSWALGDEPFWEFLYRFGTLPATLVVLASLAGYAASWYWERLRRWRRVFLFNILLAVVGPGIISNAMLKEYWGRPRPREVEGMGGHSRFEEILTIDPASDGKSFPCGHATMGFYFMGGFFLLRRYRRGLAEAFLFGGLALGGLMGIARMVQGGHFFTDVVWAGAVCYFTAMGLHYGLGLHRGLTVNVGRTGRMPLWVKGATVAAALGLITAVLLASPYRDRRNLYILEDFAKSGPLDVRLRLMLGETEIVPGEKFRITGEAYGHGVPTSRIVEQYLERDRGEHAEVMYLERLSGWLAEVNEQLEVRVPWHRLRRLKIDTGEAALWVRLAAVDGRPMIRLVGGTGDVHVDVAGRSLAIRGGEEAVIEGRGNVNVVEESQADYLLDVRGDFAGRIVFEKPEQLDGAAPAGAAPAGASAAGTQ